MLATVRSLSYIEFGLHKHTKGFQDEVQANILL